MVRKVFWFLLILVFSATAQAHQKDKELEQRVARLERMADNPVLMKFSRRLGEQQREIQELQDQIDRLQYQLKNLSKQLDKRYKESDDRLSKLEKQQGIKAQPSAVKSLAPTVVAPLTVNGEADSVSKADVSQAAPESKVIKTRAATADEKAEYKKAFSLMKQSKYQQAVKAFNQFRQSHAQSSLASNASYWAGEAYIVLGEKESALEAFKDVIETYPKSSKVPASMLRSADTMQEIGQTKQARKLYQDLIAKYPENTVAGKAKKRLEALK